MCIVGVQFPASDRTMLKNYKMLVTCNEKFEKLDNSLSKRYFNNYVTETIILYTSQTVQKRFVEEYFHSNKLQNSHILEIVLQLRAFSSVDTSAYQIRYLHRKHRLIELDH